MRDDPARDDEPADGRPDASGTPRPADMREDAAADPSTTDHGEDEPLDAEPLPNPPLTDGELEQCTDAMKRVYIMRSPNIRTKHLLNVALRRVLSNRREDLPRDRLRDGHAIAVYGESRAGKSILVKRLLNRTAAFADPVDDVGTPLVQVQVKGPATLLSVGLQILEALGYAMHGKVAENLVWRRVYQQLALNKVLAVHLDEFANVSGTLNAPDRTKLRNTIKSLIINELNPVVVILSGLPEIVPFLKQDAQISKRSSFVHVPPLQPEHFPTVAEGIRRIASAVSMGVDELELVDEIVPRLDHAASHQLGLAMEYAVEAVTCALAPEDENGLRMPPDPVLRLLHFAKYYEGLTGNAPWANPFSAKDWDAVDPHATGLVFRPPPDEGEGKGTRK